MTENRSSSLVGRQVGPYKIHSLLGVGGMGEVYLAQDPRLDRAIALKILPTELASDPERIRRFVREAKAASGLKHPNVATIYEIGKSDEFHFIAMEYVEGQTLANKISGRPLPIADIVDIGTQVADALDDAHRKGITHRDIKPANVMLTSREQVKILDFGLAKVTPPEGRPIGSDISTVMKTETGLVMGTVQYMSPEQVLGKEVDHRSDIFSLGVVLYEMATGRLPFTGTSSSETMDRVLHGQPEAIARFNYDVPAELDRIIRKLLEKDRDLRYQTAADLRTDLKRLRRDTDSVRGQENAAQGVPVAGHSASTATAGPSSAIRSSTRWRKILIASGVLAVLLIGLGLGWYARQRPRSEVELKQRQLTTNPFETPVHSAKISPDGKYLAYSDDTGVILKVIDTGERNVLAVPDGARIADLNWFPDGNKLLAIGFVGEETTSKVWMLSVFGGPPRLFQDNAGRAAVSPDGSQIALIRGDQKSIWLMKANGEDYHSILGAPTDDYFMELMWFPDGKRLGYERYRGGTDKLRASLESCDLEGRQIATVASTPGKYYYMGGSCILPTGDILYWMGPWWQNDSSLWQIHTNLRSGQPLGEPRRVMSSSGFSVRAPSSSVDGKRLAFLKGTGQLEVYVGELQGNGSRLKTPRRLTWDTEGDYPAAWTPDSKALLLSSNRNGNDDIFKQSLGERTAQALVASPEGECDPTVTPDGQWILYFSAETWRRESSAAPVSLRRAPLSGGLSQVVHSEKGFAIVRCARLPFNLCVVDQRVQGQLIFSAFDPIRGKGRELARIELSAPASSQYAWDLSPDGAQIVGVIEGTNRLWVLPLSGLRPKQEVVVNGWSSLSSPRWSADGQGWYVPSQSPPGLLYVDQRGQARVVSRDGLEGIPSPDGRYLAFPTTTISSNAWMIENFDQR